MNYLVMILYLPEYNVNVGNFTKNRFSLYLNKEMTIKDRIEKEKSVFLYFFKNSCSSCQVLKPKVENLLNEKFPEMDLIFIDSAQHAELSASLNVFSNPTMILFFEGKEYKRYNQFISLVELENYIKKNYDLIYEA